MTLSTDEAIKWAFGTTSGGAFIAWAIRQLTKTMRADKLERITANAEVGSYARQQQEIDKLIKRQAELEAEIKEMQNGIALRRVDELANAGDLAVLAMLIEQMPCEDCTLQDATFIKAKTIIARLVSRSYGNHGQTATPAAIVFQ